MNFDRLRYVAERADIGAQREALLAVEMPEEPGSFLKFCELLGTRSVTEFNYRRAERNSVAKAIADAGFAVRDMTDNEIAKLHVRYMVGGHARGLADEHLYRFEFPERPGALLRFLRAIGSGWNISLFHYRNHGSDYGRVLTGIQVPPETHKEFLLHLSDLHYAYTEETENPAYKLFLGG
jgi:threonine dehydratase